MRGEELLEAMGQVDPKLVEEAERPPKRKKKKNYGIYYMSAAVAACLALFIGLGVWNFREVMHRAEESEQYKEAAADTGAETKEMGEEEEVAEASLFSAPAEAAPAPLLDIRSVQSYHLVFPAPMMSRELQESAADDAAAENAGKEEAAEKEEGPAAEEAEHPMDETTKAFLTAISEGVAVTPEQGAEELGVLTLTFSDGGTEDVLLFEGNLVQLPTWSEDYYRVDAEAFRAMLEHALAQ